MKIQKVLKILAVLLMVYVGLVILFESLLGYFQPAYESTIVVSTVDSGGDSHSRVVQGLSSEGKLYVAVNHWPRAWFRHIQNNPDIEVAEYGSEMASTYFAVLVEGGELTQVMSDNPVPFMFRVLTGFPPRYFLRLDPK